MGISMYSLTTADLNILNSASCKLVFSGTDLVVGDKIRNNLVYFGRKKNPSDPFFLTEIGFIDASNNKYPFSTNVIEGDAYSVNTGTLTTPSGGTVTIKGVYVEIGNPSNKVYEFTQPEIDNIISSKCTLLVNNNEVLTPISIYDGDIVIIKPTNDDYLVHIESITFNEGSFDNKADFWEYVANETILTNFSFNSFIYIHKLTNDDLNNFNINKADFFINDNRALLGDFIKPNDTIKFIAHPNREFREHSVYFRTTFTSNYFIINDSGDIATLFLNPSYYGSNSFRGIDVETWQKRPPLILGYNNVYTINSDSFKQLVKAEFTEGDLDLSPLVIGCVNIPFIIPEYFIMGEEDIVLGDYNSGIKGNLLASDRIEIDLGTIEILPEYGDFRDFINTEYNIQIPYTDNITIPINFAVGYSVTVKYIVNLYNAECIINVYSSAIEGVLINKIISLNTEIPLVLTNNNPNDVKNIVLGGFNDVKGFKIIKTAKIPLNNDSKFLTPIKDNGILPTSGYVVVEDIKLEGVLTNSEELAIISFLKNGVFIND